MPWWRDPATMSAVVLAAPSCILFDFAGDGQRGVAAAGVLCGYALQLLGLAESSCVVMWLTVLVQAGCHIVRSFGAFGLSGRALTLAVLGSVEVLLIGVFFSLRFDGLAHHPRIAALCKCLLTNLLPLPSAAILTWGVSASWGAEAAPYTLLAALGGAHQLLTAQPDVPSHDDAPPAASAHREGGNLIIGKWLHSMCVLVLPLLFYLCLHRPSLSGAVGEHAIRMAAMAAAALLLLAVSPATISASLTGRSLRTRCIRAAVAVGGVTATVYCLGPGTVTSALRACASTNIDIPAYGIVLLLGLSFMVVGTTWIGAARPIRAPLLVLHSIALAAIEASLRRAETEEDAQVRPRHNRHCKALPSGRPHSSATPLSPPLVTRGIPQLHLSHLPW